MEDTCRRCGKVRQSTERFLDTVGGRQCVRCSYELARVEAGLEAMNRRPDDTILAHRVDLYNKLSESREVVAAVLGDRDDHRPICEAPGPDRLKCQHIYGHGGTKHQSGSVTWIGDQLGSKEPRGPRSGSAYASRSHTTDGRVLERLYDTVILKKKTPDAEIPAEILQNDAAILKKKAQILAETMFPGRALLNRICRHAQSKIKSYEHADMLVVKKPWQLWATCCGFTQEMEVASRLQLVRWTDQTESVNFGIILPLKHDSNCVASFGCCDPRALGLWKHLFEVVTG